MFEASAERLNRWVASLADLSRDVSDAERVDRMRALEALKCAAAAAQARDAVDLDLSQRARQEEAGVPTRRIGEGVAAQLGLARRESPHRAARLLGLAKVLEAEMPHTLALMTGGELSEWRATILARETACLSLEDRREVDRQLCGSGDAAAMGDRELAAAARRLAYRVDGESVTARARKAETERAVTIRPAPDTMTWVTALLPVRQGVAVYAALRRAADAARAEGDPRSGGQVMADTLVERVTGTPARAAQRLELRLVMTDRTLLRGDDEPAYLPGYGWVPAQWGRDEVSRACGEAEVWLRRLYTTPGAGRVVAMDARSRLAPSGLADLVAGRDLDRCRTPWCGAPPRATDHAREHRNGGATTEANLQALCERCNLAKQAPGWSARPRPGPRHTVETTTPTGHRHLARAPALPGTDEGGSRLEAAFRDLILIA